VTASGSVPSSRSSSATASRRSALRPVITTLAPACARLPCDPTSDPARGAGDDDHPPAHVVLDHAAEDNAEVLMPGSGGQASGSTGRARSRSSVVPARGIGAGGDPSLRREDATLWLGDVLGRRAHEPGRRAAGPTG
jgi:hypothetical protein